MIPRSRELFRQALLVALIDFRDYQASAELLKLNAERLGFKVDVEEVSAEMQYLSDKGLVKEEKALISPELKRWRITADGRDYLAEKGLA